MMLLKKEKAIGFYTLLLAGLLAVVSFIRYIGWAPAHDAMNSLILLGLIAGFAVNVLLIFFDSDYLIIVMTALYSIALFQLLVDSVGSFVDAYQGIVMFGDPSQVGTILSISALITASIAASVFTGFLRRKKTA